MTDAEELLALRAQRLARPPPEDESGGTRRLVFFESGGERWAIDPEFARGTVRLRELVVVPLAPRAIVAATLDEGELVPIVDLRLLFDGEPSPLADHRFALLVGDPPLRIGLLMLDVGAVADVASSSLHPAPRGFGGNGLVWGATEESVAVLDGAALLADERLFAGEGRSS